MDQPTDEELSAGDYFRCRRTLITSSRPTVKTVCFTDLLPALLRHRLQLAANQHIISA
jgi:hypothetical protein